MKQKVFLSFFCLSLFVGTLAHANAATPADDAVPGLSKYTNQVSVSATRGKVIPKEFWGTNLLSWENTDERLANGEKQLLADIPIQLLRYPGGTVADNFDWKTATLYNKKMFPKQDGPETTDFDEFMALCRDINAQPILVVNTQRFAYLKDIDAGAQHAADWVKYCKDNNFAAKYWEIGNETYLHHILTATEYGKLVKTYAAAMKAVDPSIKIFANGRWKHDDAGAKDELRPQYRDSVVQMYYDAEFAVPQKAAPSKDNIIEDFKAIGGITTEAASAKWWPNVMRECGDVIDGFVVHYYYGSASEKNKSPEDYPGEDINIGQDLIRTRKLIEQESGRTDLIFAITEYNCNNDNAKFAGASLAEGLGRFLDAGADMSNFWPFTFNSFSDGVMINRDDNNKKQYPYIIFQEMSKIFKGQRVACTHNQKLNYYAVASHSDTNDAVMLTNTSNQDINITIDFSQVTDRVALNDDNITIAQYANDKTDKLSSVFKKSAVSYKIGDGFLNVTLKAFSVLFLNLSSVEEPPTPPSGPVLLGEFNFTQSNDFVAKNVADGVSFTNLEIGTGLTTSRANNLLKVSNWEHMVNIKNNKRYVGVKISADAGKIFDFTSFSIKHKGNLKNFQINQGADLATGALGISSQITGDKTSLVERTFTIADNKVLADQTELFLAIGSAADNNSNVSTDWVNNYAQFESIKFYGEIKSSTHTEQVVLGKVAVIGRTIILSELDAECISVYNTSGILVKQIQLDGSSAQFELRDSGLYLIRIESENGVNTRKVLLY